MSQPLHTATATSTGDGRPGGRALRPAYGIALQRLYLVRFAFALVWATLLLLTTNETGPGLTVLLIAYPLFDAGAVLWQLRADPGAKRSKPSEAVNIAVSVVVAIVLGVASTESIAAVLGVWGAWAIGSGIPQLITAIRNRRAGGQVPQMLSGGISVLAGGSFLAEGFHDGDSLSGIGGYATLGGIFFLISAIRLGVTLRKQAGPMSSANETVGQSRRDAAQLSG